MIVIRPRRARFSSRKMRYKYRLMGHNLLMEAVEPLLSTLRTTKSKTKFTENNTKKQMINKLVNLWLKKMITLRTVVLLVYRPNKALNKVK